MLATLPFDASLEGGEVVTPCQTLEECPSISERESVGWGEGLGNGPFEGGNSCAGEAAAGNAGGSLRKMNESGLEPYFQAILHPNEVPPVAPCSPLQQPQQGDFVDSLDFFANSAAPRTLKKFRVFPHVTSGPRGVSVKGSGVSPPTSVISSSSSPKDSLKLLKRGSGAATARASVRSPLDDGMYA